MNQTTPTFIHQTHRAMPSISKVTPPYHHTNLNKNGGQESTYENYQPLKNKGQKRWAANGGHTRFPGCRAKPSAPKAFPPCRLHTIGKMSSNVLCEFPCIAVLRSMRRIQRPTLTGCGKTGRRIPFPPGVVSNCGTDAGLQTA